MEFPKLVTAYSCDLVGYLLFVIITWHQMLWLLAVVALVTVGDGKIQ